jgi:hypothetical protein
MSVSFSSSSPSSMRLLIASSELRWELLIPSSYKLSLLFIIGLQRFFELPSVGVCVSMWIYFLMLVNLGTLCVSKLISMILWQWQSSINSFNSLLKLGQPLMFFVINTPFSLSYLLYFDLCFFNSIMLLLLSTQTLFHFQPSLS